MTDRTKAAPGLLAELAMAAPARIVKRLDAQPGVARAWTWDGDTVQTESGETVTLLPTEGVVSSVDAVRCSCLLSPRCFHALAVISALDIADGAADEPATSDSAHDLEHAETATVSAGMQQAAQLTLRLSENLLRTGASNAGAVIQGEWLRVVHHARIEGAHRLASAGLRVVRNVRELREERPSFSASRLVADLADATATARKLQATATEATWVGVGRRSYSHLGNLRLRGLCCEPVVSRAGYAGVVSWVCDDEGTVYTISDILPAAAPRARGAYDLGIQLGDTAISHRELCRNALLVHNATGSGDRRLGAGKDVRAARCQRPPDWDDAGWSKRFNEPLEQQINRAFEASDTPPELLPHAARAVFAQGTLLGTDGTALLLKTEDCVLRLIAADNRPELAYVGNLQILARAAGAHVRCVGHLVPSLSRTLAAVSMNARPEALALPPELAGCLNLGLDVLQNSQIAGEPVCLSKDETGWVNPLLPIRRRLERLVLYGVRSLPLESWRAVRSEAVALGEIAMPAAGAVLEELHRVAAAIGEGREVDSLANAFLATVTFERAAARTFSRLGVP